MQLSSRRLKLLQLKDAFNCLVEFRPKARTDVYTQMYVCIYTYIYTPTYKKHITFAATIATKRLCVADALVTASVYVCTYVYTELPWD